MVAEFTIFYTTLDTSEVFRRRPKTRSRSCDCRGQAVAMVGHAVMVGQRHPRESLQPQQPGA